MREAAIKSYKTEVLTIFYENNMMYVWNFFQ